MTDPVRNS